MSVSIFWRPSLSGMRFKGGTDADLEALTEIFSGYIPSGSGDLLRSLGRALKSQEFYNEVADVVDRHGAIKFWGEY